MKMRILMALAVATIAAGCGTPGVPSFDSMIKDWSETARVAYAEGNAARAADLYERALDRARLTDTPAEVGRIAYNLAVCKAALGCVEEARALLAQAESLLPEGKPERARARMAEAELDHAGGMSDKAVAAARSILAGRADRDTQAQARVLLAEAAMRGNDRETCAAELKRAMGKLEDESEPLLWARAEGVAAWLAQGEDRHSKAGRAFEEKAQWLGKAGQYRGMAAVLAEAADAYAKGADYGPAAGCALRSAQSLAASGEKDKAVQLARQAAGWADKAGDESGRRHATALLAEWGVH